MDKSKEKAASTEDVTAISERLLKQNMEAYEMLPFHAFFLRPEKEA